MSQEFTFAVNFHNSEARSLSAPCSSERAIDSESLIYKRNDRSRTLVSAFLIFLFAFTVYFLAPITWVMDSEYTIALSQTLVKHGTFHLDHMRIPPERIKRQWGHVYQLDVVHHHVFYSYPPGSSILSVPFAITLNWAGISALKPDGTYNRQGEQQIQRHIAPMVTAITVSLIFLTARIWLPLTWSWLVGVVAGFATPLFSTSSRALWTHTWSGLLFSAVIYLLCRQEHWGRGTPIWLASLLSMAFFTRPIAVIPIVAVSLYLLLKMRSAFLLYLLTGLVWLALFFWYCWRNFGGLSDYYRVQHMLGSPWYWTALAGHLISPSRGFLIFSPFFLLVAYLLIGYRRKIARRDLCLLALAVLTAHVLLIADLPIWWAGASYGPRLITDAIPWLMLLTIFAVDAGRRSGAFSSSILVTLAALLVAFSIFTHTRGAFSFDTLLWTDTPTLQKKIWDWKNPQFAAGLFREPRGS